jgi:hypothetical protein
MIELVTEEPGREHLLAAGAAVGAALVLGLIALRRRRAAQDPTVALLDALAAVADVLTFYQDRIAEEAWLGTGRRRRRRFRCR